MKSVKRLTLVFCVLAFVVVCSLGKAQDERPLTFCFLDAYDGEKWGDCTLITFPTGEVMLLDTGISDAAANVVERLRKDGIERIQYLVLSHLHSDHYGSMKKIIENFTVDAVYSNFYTPPEQRWIAEWLSERDIPYVRWVAGDSIDVSSVHIEAIWPLPETVLVSPQESASLDPVIVDVNNHSLVLHFSYAGKTALFTGDIHKSGEAELLELVAPELLDVDLLKIMHHGHGTSGSAAFLDVVSPEYAVMMGGIVMTLPEYKKYVERGCWPYATWMNGEVSILFYQDRIETEAERPEINEYYQKLRILYP